LKASNEQLQTALGAMSSQIEALTVQSVANDTRNCHDV
jgi:hypothetical protein